MGGAVQSFSSPMLAQGMQGSLSGFGTSGLGTFAKGGQVKMVKRDEGNYWYRRTEGAIGSFQWKYDNRYPEGILFPLDEFDTKFYQSVKLKKGEMLFRYETDVMVGGIRPLIKLNLDKSLIYFMADSDNYSDEDEPKFESRGIKAEYIVLEEGYDKKFAEGGEVVSEIERKYALAGKDSGGVWTYSKITADEIAKKYKGSVQEDGSKWYVSINKFAKGGKIGFEALSNKVARSYKGKKVKPQYQDEYGKTYDAQEAKEVGDKVASKVYRQQLTKKGMMAKGGEVEEMAISKSRLEFAKYNLSELEKEGKKSSNSSQYREWERFKKQYENKIKRLEETLNPTFPKIKMENISDEDLKKKHSRVLWNINELRLGNLKPSKVIKKGRVTKEKADQFLMDLIKQYEIEMKKRGMPVYAQGGEVNEIEDANYTYKTLNEIAQLKEKGFKTISLNGFDESINYVLDLNLDDTEIKKVGENSYETTYAKGGEVEELKVGDIVTHKKGREYGHGRIYKTSSIGIYLEDKYGNKREQPFYFPSDFKKVKKMFADGGEADVHIENADVNFDEKHYKGLLSDFDLDGLPNVDDPDPFGNQDKKSIEQVKFSKTFKKVLDTKEDLDVELKKFVSKLQNSTSSDEKIYARSKTPFSILNKLVDSRLLDEKRGLKDLVGTTITFKNTEDLKKYMKKVRRGDLGKVIDFDDYYANPNDGYRAYHFIIEQDGIPIELQLKTDRMKEVNILSHDAYKNKSLNKEYMLYLTSLANEADNGNGFSKEQFNMIMRNKAEVRKMLNSKNN